MPTVVRPAAAFALLIGCGLSSSALAQSQSWDVPLSVGPISGTLSGTLDRSNQGLSGTFGYAGTGGGNGYNATLDDSGAWSVNRNSFDETFGAGGTIAGNGQSASGVGLEAGSATRNGGSLSYGLGGSVAGDRSSTSGARLGSVAVGPNGVRSSQSSGSSAASPAPARAGQ
jgi:hypothetical protein